MIGGRQTAFGLGMAKDNGASDAMKTMMMSWSLEKTAFRLARVTQRIEAAAARCA
jgi:hypothetical protein